LVQIGDLKNTAKLIASDRSIQERGLEPRPWHPGTASCQQSIIVERQIPDIHQNRSVFEASMKICTEVDPPKGSWKKYPQHIRAPGGRHPEIQYGLHFGPISITPKQP